jgi:hypothetical protein
MNFVKKYWLWAAFGVAILVFVFKPNWLKTKNGGGPVGGTVGGTLPKPASGTGMEF